MYPRASEILKGCIAMSKRSQPLQDSPAGNTCPNSTRQAWTGPSSKVPTKASPVWYAPENGAWRQHTFMSLASHAHDQRKVS